MAPADEVERLSDELRFIANGDADAFGSVVQGENAHKMKFRVIESSLPSPPLSLS